MEATPHTPASIRTALGMTQVELADRATVIARETDPAADVSSQTVSRMERGEGVRVDHLRPIAAALGVTVDVLLAAMDVERARRAKGAA